MKKKIDDFCHLHTHSDHSQLDGCGHLHDFVDVAVERGHRGIAFTEHGTMRGFHALTKATEEKPIQPIYGTEFYVSPDMKRRGLTDEEKEAITKDVAKKADYKAAIKQYEFDTGLRDRWHLTVHAKNDEGLRNLYKLNSLAWLEGYYYKPRIDLATLCAHGDGLMVSSGCLSSPINSKIAQGKRRDALEMAEQLATRFGEDFWLEVQPHDIDEQRNANKFAAELREKFPDSKLLAMQDAHYVREEDWQAHEVMLCVGTGTLMSNPNRFKFDGTEFYFRTREQMAQAFDMNHDLSPAHVKEALDSTVEFVERCKAKVVLDRFKALLPDPGIPESYGGDSFEYIKDLCVKGWQWREIPQRAETLAKKRSRGDAKEILKEYRERLKFELRTLRERKVVDYFLIVRDVYNFARSNDIGSGAGRGSGAGCLISFLLGITAADPIEHRLLFDRFLAPGRQDLPDIDCDFEDVRRGEIIEYLRQKYGEDKVAQIATVPKLSGKQVVKDVCRVLEVPYTEANRITKAIIERDAGDERANNCVEDSFSEFKILKQFNEAFPDVLKHARKLEGMAKGLGIHAAGVVTSPIPLTNVVPLETRKRNPKTGEQTIVTAVDMFGVQDLGLLKLDILGVRTLSVCHDARRMVERRRGLKIDLEKLDLDDPEILQGFTDSDFVAVFQFDSPSAAKVSANVEFKRFEDVSTLTALNRPGSTRTGRAAEYVKALNDPVYRKEKLKGQPKAVTEICEDTNGFIVYQEHVIRIFREVAGYTAEEADRMRRKIGKRVGAEEMEHERHTFKEGCSKHSDMSLEVSDKLFDGIVQFGAYGFNKSHATAYSVVSFWCMYLKKKFPLEFYWAALLHEPDPVKIQQIGKDATRHGVDVLPPDVSFSKSGFSIDENRKAIRGSLIDIKHVGTRATETLVENQPFTNLFDFVSRIDLRLCNKRAVFSLAKAGALDSLNIPNLRAFVENFERLWAFFSGEKRIVNTKGGSKRRIFYKEGDIVPKGKTPQFGLKRDPGSGRAVVHNKQEKTGLLMQAWLRKGLAFPEIAAKLNALELKTPLGRKWTKDSAADYYRLWVQGKAGTRSSKVMLEDFFASSGGDDYTEEDKVLLAATVNPVALGMHPIDAYEKFMNGNVGVPITALDDEEFFEIEDGSKTKVRRYAYVCGVIVDVKKSQVGDFHKGEIPDEEERVKMRWGLQYANVNIEDASGKQRRIKFDWDVFENYRDLIEQGPGTPLIALVLLNKQYESCRVSFAIDLEAYRQAASAGEEFSAFEKLVRGDHPSKLAQWAKKSVKAEVRGEFSRRALPHAAGIVTHVRTKFDKRGNLMGWFGLAGETDFVEAICFGSDWPDIEKAVKPGRFLYVRLKRQQDRGDSYSFLFNGTLKRLEQKN
jgi:DNA polymerase-3 subunit alpha